MTILVLTTHELAHLLVARGYGLEIDYFELTPFGGVMNIPYPIELDPLVEMSVALAGPLNNLLFLAAGIAVQKHLLLSGSALSFFLDLNLSMALFNLIPVLPLDGGRVYRAFLSARMGYRDATMSVLKLRTLILFSTFLVGLVSAVRGKLLPLSLAFALFLASNTRAIKELMNLVALEGTIAKTRKLASKGQLPVKQIMALESVTVRTLVASFQPDAYHIVIVCDRRFQQKGMLTEQEVVRALYQGKHDWPLGNLLKG
ncbi:MAG TPA: hypothetical protein GXX40_03735 [Firmicutes bacterium]|nr:hypothetical protein [Bacillota bacterium]